MTSRNATRRHDDELRELHAQERSRGRRRRSVALVAWGAGLLVLAAVVTFGLVNSQPEQTTTNSLAAPFTLTDTSGAEVSLADYRGRNVILYFSEGAGCQSCLVQMADIERRKADFDAANLVVLPIVMNTVDQITSDMAANGVTTPFLLDDGSVSTAYGTIGKGMHGGLPGHSFVVIDAEGIQRWYGEYPSMWLSPDELLAQANSALSS